ncbi:S24 family peptidase [Bordetella sp. 15P40C-2]|uniref:S24 family peptidase n=1 Tax=Bordetella sp. 15P40C-2 TaxID=2572246 RepID=UPI0013247C8C|nr:S24 family peptidase [Bordetella sp. 15P40C-2]MVW72156.1 helix-turn-helix transcriptional regulator [Bordetella sp. 15P40C-2]
MKDIDQIRRDNLRSLEAEAGGPSAAAKLLEMSPAQFMNLRDGAKDSKTGKPRGMRKDTARRIESAAGKPPGWLDTPHGENQTGEQLEAIENPRLCVTIGRYDTGGRMGLSGVELRDQPGVIESLKVSREWLEKNVRGYSQTNSLCVVTGFGDSMRPMFNSGDPLIIDSSVKAVEFDAVYFFRVGNEGFIKRLQRVPGKGLLAISENPAYRDWVIDETMDLEVFGRVLKVWRSEDF